MSTESPLFQSALELIAHAITHFNGREELDRKLVILHLANAVELILKDVLLEQGESIYKNPKETLTITGTIQKLKELEIRVPFLNKIELLIDERNALQHRFGSPNELTTIFYMDVTTEFFRELLQNHYGLNFDETIEQFADKQDLLAFRMRQPTDESELEGLKKLASIHPLGALLSAMAYLERRIDNFSEKTGISALRRYPGIMSYRTLRRYGMEIPPNLVEGLEYARRVRNLAAHGRGEPTQEEVLKVIQIIEEFDNFLTSIDSEALENIERRVREEELHRREEAERRRRREEQLLQKRSGREETTVEPFAEIGDDDEIPF